MEFSIELWRKQVTLIMANNGLASFIIHPDYSMEGASLAVYERLLGYLADLRTEHQLWTALPREVDCWWRDRSQMELVWKDGKWRVRGDHSGRAMVAYASTVGDRVEYSFDLPDENRLVTQSRTVASC